ncbi:MBL fold metallo-hydrolase [Paenibacillus sp. M1]|uniref:MBL fold metallo-hydrolase n=1 Tax=Paenibacillus haidiansis TaxID=1574488 RepID=A0ABU7VW94_9BACL
MKITENIEVLELTLPAGEGQMTIHPTVIRDEHGCVLVDTGMPGCYRRIMDLIAQAGIDPAALHAVILTHQDIDHVGSLPQFISGNGGKPKVYAHAEDKPYIDGKKLLIKFSPARKEALLQALPEPLAKQFEAVFSTDSSENVTHVLADGQRLPFGGGLTVIHTPGHTPGHISLYHEPSKTLIAGDAMIVQDGMLQGPNPVMTPDMPLALQSLRKLKAYPIETVVCYHGGIYRGDVSKRIEEIIEA